MTLQKEIFMGIGFGIFSKNSAFGTIKQAARRMYRPLGRWVEHRPEVTLLPFDSSEEPSSWRIVEEEEALVLRTDEAELRLVKLSSWRD